MVSFRPLDPEFPIERQMGIDAGPVVLVNLFIAVLFHAFSTAERHDGVSKAMEAAVKGMSSEERSEEVTQDGKA